MKSRLALFTAAIIWGFAFVAQRKGMESVQPFTFNAVRFLVGCIALLPLMFINRRQDIHKSTSVKTIFFGGALTGLVLFIAASLQQIGLVYTSAGKAGFITGLYVVLVPIMGLALQHRIGAWTWLGAFASIIGLYLLTITDTLTIEQGDLFLLAGAFFWTTHVHLVGYFSARIGAIRLSLIQSAIVVIASLIVALSVETIRVEGLVDAALPILFTGVLSIGVAYTLQIVGQRNTPPSQAAIILSLESVFAVIGGWLLLGESLPAKELIGCGLMFAGMTVSQLDNELGLALQSRATDET